MFDVGARQSRARLAWRHEGMFKIQAFDGAVAFFACVNPQFFTFDVDKDTLANGRLPFDVVCIVMTFLF